VRLLYPCAASAVLAVAVSAGVSAQNRGYSPPRLLSAELPAEPSPTVVGGGEVLIEFIVDVRGTVTRPTIVRSTPPYTQMVLDAIARWQFEPARAADERGVARPIQAPLTVSALYRPPTLYNGPTVGESPKLLARPSGDVAYPLEIVSPAFPPNALFGSVLLFEVGVSESGQLVAARGLAPSSGFDGAARDSLAKMRFQAATYRARPVPSVTYVMFGFRQPTSFASPVPIPR
jgi:TonB family protein